MNNMCIDPERRLDNFNIFTHQQCTHFINHSQMPLIVPYLSFTDRRVIVAHCWAGVRTHHEFLAEDSDDDDEDGHSPRSGGRGEMTVDSDISSDDDMGTIVD